MNYTCTRSSTRGRLPQGGVRPHLSPFDDLTHYLYSINGHVLIPARSALALAHCMPLDDFGSAQMTAAAALAAAAAAAALAALAATCSSSSSPCSGTRS